MTEKENHPIRHGFVPDKTEILVVGTFPPTKEYVSKKDGFFFYSSEKNQFWNRIDNIFPEQRLKKTRHKNKDQSFVENRKQKETFSKSKNLGFLDVFTVIRRKTKASSNDIDLIPVQTILQNGQFNSIIISRPIRRVCCTYTLAYEKLKCGLPLVGYSIEHKRDGQTANGEILEVSGHGKKFEVVLLYPATRSRHKGVIKDRQYEKYLFN